MFFSDQFPRKIGIIGTHSTGKTTLAQAIADRHNIPFVRSDRAREIANVLTPSVRLDELSPETQWKLQQLFLRGAEEISERDQSFVTDCCALTCDPYAHALLKDFVVQCDGFDDFLTRARASTDKLSHLFYLPPEIDLFDDGFRPTSNALRLSLDRDLLACLEQQPFSVLTGTVERRMEQAGLIMGHIPRSNSVWSNYIALEGLPSSGKSTQLRAHLEWFKQLGTQVYVCKRFGTPERAAKLTQLYTDPERNRDELRAIHIESFLEQYHRNEVLSRLEAGQIVIADRQKFSVIAMQRALGTDFATLYRDTAVLPTPGTILYFSCSPKISVRRSEQAQKANHLKRDLSFQARVKTAYDWLAEHHTEFNVINANRSPEEIGTAFRATFNAQHVFTTAVDDVLVIFDQYLLQGTKPWTADTACRDLSYQVGTLSKILLQLDGFVHDHGLTREEMLGAAKLDIGDILTLTLFIAHQLGINPDRAFREQLRDDIKKIRSRLTHT